MVINTDFQKGRNLVNKKKDPNYKHIAGYVPKDLALRFRVACSQHDISLNDALEIAVGEWLDRLVKEGEG